MDVLAQPVRSTGITVTRILEGGFSPHLFEPPLGLKEVRPIKISPPAAETTIPMRFAEVLESRILAVVAHGRGDLRTGPPSPSR